MMNHTGKKSKHSAIYLLAYITKKNKAYIQHFGTGTISVSRRMQHVLNIIFISAAFKALSWRALLCTKHLSQTANVKNNKMTKFQQVRFLYNYLSAQKKTKLSITATLDGLAFDLGLSQAQKCQEMLCV